MIYNKMIRTKVFKIVLLCVIIFSSLLQQNILFAQQDPLFTQYMFNPLFLNPAYAGSNDMLSVRLLSRQQWLGFDGAPATQSFSVNSPVYASNVGLGASIINDKTGPTQQTGFYLDYAYHLFLKKDLHLSMGLKGGFNYFRLDLNQLSKTQAIDPSYDNPVQSSFLPNFGFGLYLYSSKFYVGASIPKLMENKYESEEDGVVKNGKETRHYFFTAGGIIPSGSNLIFKPSIITRMNMGSPLSIDLNLNAIYMNKIWIGAMYRVNEAYGAILQYQITNQFRFGYAYDQSTSELSNYNQGSHEIMLGFELNFKKEKVQNPRYF